MESEVSVSRIITWLLKALWKVFLNLLWGFLRLTEVLCGQFALWIKSIIN